MTEWVEVPLGDLGRVVTGRTPPARSPEAFGDIYPFITPSDMDGRRFIDESERYISEAGAEAMPRQRLPARTVLVSCIGWQLGKVAITTRESFTNQQLNSVLPAAGSVDPLFLYYHLCTRREEIKRLAAGGTRTPLLNKTRFEALPILLPPRTTQARIVAVLGAIDDLIENNQRRIGMLEEMARATYLEWFVNFRYPGHENATFVDSPRGSIPEGWRATRLDRVADVNRSSRNPASGETVRYLDISALGDRSIGELSVLNGSEAPGRARRMVSAGDVAWSMVRPNRRAHALLVEPGEEWIGSTGLAVLTPTAISSALLFEAVSAREFSDYLVSQQGGAAYPAVKPKDFEAAILLVPEPELDRRFAETVGPHHRLVWTLRNQSASLAAMRDLILPRLVKGLIEASSLDLDALVVESVR